MTWEAEEHTLDNSGNCEYFDDEFFESVKAYPAQQVRVAAFVDAMVESILQSEHSDDHQAFDC